MYVKLDPHKIFTREDAVENMNQKKGKWIVLNILLGLLVILAGCAPGGIEESEKGTTQDETEKKGKIVIGSNNWAENIAVSNMWNILLKEKGYDVEIKAMEKSPLWIGLSQGDIDLSLELWLPTTDKPLMDKYKDKVELHDVWYEGAGSGLVVPKYVNVDNIEELNANKDLFQVNGKPSIVGIEPGTSLMRMTDEAIQDYGLELELVNGSEAMMLGALEKAISNKEPVLVGLWNPHWAFNKYELKYLKDPKTSYGEPDDIYYFSRLGFSSDYPEVKNWLDKWQMDDNTLGSLMAVINESPTPEEGAEKWIKENREVVDQWLQQ